MAAILDRYPQPDIGRYLTRLEESRHPRGSLGQHLVRMLRRTRHHIDNAFDISVRHLLVEEIGHRIDEIDGGLLASKRLLQALRQQGQRKAVLVSGRAHGLQPARQRLGVTVLAAGRNLGAPGDRVPRLLGPLNLRCRRHDVPP